MNMTEQQIERFFQDECNAEEAEQVIAYLDSHPDIVERYMSEAEWSAFKYTERLHPVLSEKMQTVIRRSTYSEAKTIGWKKWAAVAAVTLMISFGMYYLLDRNNRQENKQLAKEETKEERAQLKLVRNTSDKVQEIKLSDGSVVMLEANSELRFMEAFEKNHRVINLSGEALFTVAKDAARPFTVVSDEVATTALGTVFRVTAVEQGKVLKVHLYEGKVVIKNATGKSTLTEDYFLKPGDEFVFDRSTMLANILMKKKPSINAAERSNDKPVEENASNWFMFNNQKLSQVFDQLAAIYNVKIDYNATEVSKMSFIGRIDKSDAIEDILNDIALLNNLTVTKTGTGFTIEKK